MTIHGNTRRVNNLYPPTLHTLRICVLLTGNCHAYLRTDINTISKRWWRQKSALPIKEFKGGTVMVQQLVHSIDWSGLEQRTNAASISSPQHFISLMDWSSGELINLLHSAVYLKRDYIRSGNYPLLQGKTLAMIFERPSLRTRVSFEMAMQHLGGTAICIREDEIGLGRRESTPDIARVLGNYVHGIIARLSKRKHLVELAESSSVPVINGLTEYNHPCQAMADVMTIYEEFGHLEGIKVVYIGSILASAYIFTFLEVEIRVI
jgi:hypothetical protein